MTISATNTSFGNWLSVMVTDTDEQIICSMVPRTMVEILPRYKVVPYPPIISCFQNPLWSNLSIVYHKPWFLETNLSIVTQGPHFLDPSHEMYPDAACGLKVVLDAAGHAMLTDFGLSKDGAPWLPFCSEICAPTTKNRLSGLPRMDPEMGRKRTLCCKWWFVNVSHHFS